jgi:DNA-binding PadR family transcriptional regulator
MRLTRTVAKILAQFLIHGERSGWDLMQATGLASGTVYPILRRMTDAGWIEATEVRRNGNRKRQCYSITELGRAQVQSLRT